MLYLTRLPDLVEVLFTFRKACCWPDSATETEKVCYVLAGHAFRGPRPWHVGNILGAFWGQVGLGWRSDGSLDTPGTSRQDRQLGRHLVPTWPNFAPTWPNLAPTWAQLGPTSAQFGTTWPQFGPNLAPTFESWGLLAPRCLPDSSKMPSRTNFGSHSDGFLVDFYLTFS